MLDFCEGVETADSPASTALGRPLEALRHLAAGRPIELRHYHSRQFAAKIRGLASRVGFDVVDIVDSYMAPYLEALPSPLRRKTVLTFIDVVFSKVHREVHVEPRRLRRLRTWLYSRAMRNWEPSYAERFTRCITVSDADRDLLLTANPRLAIDVIPNGVDTTRYQSLGDSPGQPALVFVGNMAYRPNVDGMLLFCHEVYPRLKMDTPDLQLWITGLDPPQEVLNLAGDGVHVTGTVDDVRHLYARSTVAVVPLRAGGGTRLKILEAMALGRPVVSTTIGCEGLEVVDGEHLLVADTAQEFARKTTLLLRDTSLRTRLSQRARALVVTRYDWDVIARRLVQVYADVVRRPGGRHAVPEAMPQR
jgi:glycosyltransferase involved in cell wall biosynthesis